MVKVNPHKTLEKVIEAGPGIREAARNLPDGDNVDAIKSRAAAVAGAIESLKDAYETNERLSRDE